MTKNKNLHSAGRPKPLTSSAGTIFCVTLRVLNHHAFCNVAVVVQNISPRPKLVATAALFKLLEFHLFRLEWARFHWPDQAKRFERLLTQQKYCREQSFGAL